MLLNISLCPERYIQKEGDSAREEALLTKTDLSVKVQALLGALRTCQAQREGRMKESLGWGRSPGSGNARGARFARRPCTPLAAHPAACSSGAGRGPAEEFLTCPQWGN